MFDTGGNFMLDYIEFGPQLDDVSTARLIDGKSPWVTLMTPTPNAANLPAGCGTRAYSALDPLAHEISLALVGIPKIASTITLQLRNGVPNSVFIHLVTVAPGSLRLSNKVTLLVGLPPAILLPVPSNALGSADLPIAIPDDLRLVGQRIYMQTLGLDAMSFVGSNALEITICPK